MTGKLVRIHVVAMILASHARAEPSVDDLVSANQAAVDSIRQLDMSIESYQVKTQGVRLDAPSHQSTWRWSREVDAERQRWEQHDGYAPSKEGRPRNLGDMLESGSQRKVLMNWDPEDPQALSPENQGTLRAWFEPKSPKTPGVFPNPSAAFALFEAQATVNDLRRSLSQLVSESPSVQVSKVEGQKGEQMWQLLIAHPDDASGGLFAGCHYEVALDPAANYLARSIISVVSPTKKSPMIVPLRVERHVQDFGKTDDGIFFPLRVRMAMFDVNSSQTAESIVEVEMTAKDVVVNEPLPADAMAFTFPTGARVYEMPAVNGSYPLHIWGPDNKPVKTYTGDYKELRFPTTAIQGGFSRALLLGANIVVILAVITVLLYRRRLRSSGS